MSASVSYVGFWKRLVAMIVDTVILTIAIVVLLVPIFLILGSDPASSRGLVNAVVFGIEGVFFIWFWKAKSATPGKMIFGARIVDAKTLGKPSTGQLVGRFFAYIVSTIPLCLGFLWVAFDARKQGWHDKLSGTAVVSGGSS